MALPRIPPIGPGVSVRSGQASHIPGRVPPTPTRFTVHASASNAPHPPPPPPPSGPSSVRSPPHASVAISSLRPPPTPHSLTHATYTNEKSAFLAPFEMFYDALNDSKQLKSWLSDQLIKSQALTQSLQHQNDHIGELVENLVERKVGGMRREMAGLQRRVEELEGIIRTDTRNRSHSFSASSSSGAPPSRYGAGGSGAGPNESYAFPPIVDRRSAPQQQQPSSPPYARLSTDSPAPYETRRLSISAARLEGPGTPRDASGSIVLPPPLSRNRPSGDVPTLSSTSERERERGRDSEKV
ncbi:hypothetical protein DL96DRAFT_1467645 [Flagelloscypha sp. PMI_526]|nr:hypothetical protein DL96DRAFT_1467645 [Flagelloscypha sp. PMI_526]